MSNTNEQVEKCFPIEQTPENKGVQMTVKIVAYDNGLIQVNGNPIGVVGEIPWLAMGRFIAQGLERLGKASVARNVNKAA